jgi:hypothetical protein
VSIIIGNRPASIDGCMATWAEREVPVVIRTSMELPADIKVRLRHTAPIINIECSVTLTSDKYDDFKDWFDVSCKFGIYPTRIKRPQDGLELVARFTEPPSIEFIEKGFFHVTMKFEQLPAWKGL